MLRARTTVSPKHNYRIMDMFRVKFRTWFRDKARIRDKIGDRIKFGL